MAYEHKSTSKSSETGQGAGKRKSKIKSKSTRKITRESNRTRKGKANHAVGLLLGTCVYFRECKSVGSQCAGRQGGAG